MTENLQLQITNIQNQIYTIRGLKVMLERDLALIYVVKSTHLLKQIKRNIQRFFNHFND